MSFNKTQTRVITGLHTGHNNQESLTFPKLTCFIIHAVEFMHHTSYRHAGNVHLSNSYQLGYKMLCYLTVFHVFVRSSPLWNVCTWNFCPNTQNTSCMYSAYQRKPSLQLHTTFRLSNKQHGSELINWSVGKTCDVKWLVKMSEKIITL